MSADMNIIKKGTQADDQQPSIHTRNRSVIVKRIAAWVYETGCLAFFAYSTQILAADEDVPIMIMAMFGIASAYLTYVIVNHSLVSFVLSHRLLVIIDLAVLATTYLSLWFRAV